MDNLLQQAQYFRDMARDYFTHLQTRLEFEKFLDGVIEHLGNMDPVNGQCPNYFRTKDEWFWCIETVDHEGPCNIPAI